MLVPLHHLVAFESCVCASTDAAIQLNAKLTQKRTNTDAFVGKRREEKFIMKYLRGQYTWPIMFFFLFFTGAKLECAQHVVIFGESANDRVVPLGDAESGARMSSISLLSMVNFEFRFILPYALSSDVCTIGNSLHETKVIMQRL